MCCLLRCAKLLSCVGLFETSCTVAHQPHLSMRLLQAQEYWTVLQFPTPGDLPKPGVEPRSPALQADSLPLSHQGRPQQVLKLCSMSPPTLFFFSVVLAITSVCISILIFKSVVDFLQLLGFWLELHQIYTSVWAELTA